MTGGIGSGSAEQDEDAGDDYKPRLCCLNLCHGRLRAGVV
jgi:hypothetical protein